MERQVAIFWLSITFVGALTMALAVGWAIGDIVDALTIITGGQPVHP